MKNKPQRTKIAEEKKIERKSLQKLGKHLKKMIMSDMIIQKEFLHKGRY